MKIQTSSRKYEGQCKFCGQDFTKAQINNHLDKCNKRANKSDLNRYLRLRITDKYIKNFWLIVEVSNEAKFKDLDHLLKDVWVECCGHLSLFGDYGSEVGMSRVIIDTLELRDTIPYIYDFGSSTELVVEALCYSNYKLNSNKKIELVARNYLPKSDCMECGKQGMQICTYCFCERPAFLCNKCAKSHNVCENCYILPLANSPRTGICGYESSAPVDKLFQ